MLAHPSTGNVLQPPVAAPESGADTLGIEALKFFSRQCPHGTRSSNCSSCGTFDRSKCEHGNIRRWCRRCSPRAAQVMMRRCRLHRSRLCDLCTRCVHGRLHGWCKECGGFSFCTHGRQRRRCSVCSPGPRKHPPPKFRCPHGHIARHCRDCGSQRCPHGQRPYDCRICIGDGVCAHGRLHRQCASCSSSQTKRRQRARGRDTLPL